MSKRNICIIISCTLDSPGTWELSDGNVDSSATVYTVPDLRPASQYQFRVAAVNEVGEGSFSSPSDTINLPQQREWLICFL